MTLPLVERMLERAGQAKGLYNQLVLVVGRAGSGKTAALRQFCERIGTPLVNVGLQLSKRMLGLTARQRVLQMPQILERLVAEAGPETVVLDNTEVLFDVELRQDPMRLLQRLSRSRTIVASWNGTFEGGNVAYAEPGHSEYRSCPAQDVLIVPAVAAEG